jgi:hypothetical protein
VNFKTYERCVTILKESTKVERALEDTLRPQFVNEVLHILHHNTHSKLVRFIIQRLHNPETTETQQLEINKVSNLDSYKMDPHVYQLLVDVKAGDVGPGEILLALTVGDWEGGTGGDYDIKIDEIGDIEVKWLSPFQKSSNVPMGSAEKKRLVHTDIPNVFKGVSNIVRKTPKILRRYLIQSEIDYFIDNSLDQLRPDLEGDVSTNTLRLVGRILRGAERQGDKTFSMNKITFKRLTNSMLRTLKESMGDATHVLFIGDRIQEDDTDESVIIPGKYFILPKDDFRYWMFYRIYRGTRIKIAPFTTERDFLETTI